MEGEKTAGKLNTIQMKPRTQTVVINLGRLLIESIYEILMCTNLLILKTTNTHYMGSPLLKATQYNYASQRPRIQHIDNQLISPNSFYRIEL